MSRPPCSSALLTALDTSLVRCGCSIPAPHDTARSPTPTLPPVATASPAASSTQCPKSAPAGKTGPQPCERRPRVVVNPASPSAQDLVDPARHRLGRGAQDMAFEETRAVCPLEIYLDGAGAGGLGVHHEARRRIDLARCPDRSEQVRPRDSLVDLVHAIRHLAEPDDVRPDAARRLAGGAGVVNAHRPLPPPAMLATRAERREKFAMHVDDPLRSGP